MVRPDSEYHVAVSTTGVSNPSTIYIELNGILDNGGTFNVSQVARVQPYSTRIMKFDVIILILRINTLTALSATLVYHVDLIASRWCFSYSCSMAQL